jgi:NAD(P)-dependent dehydrogenase (short-subunit alcohol dehydrogenase family)
MSEVIVVGAGSIGQAIARRVSAGKHVVVRVMAEAVRWGKRGARINTISPGIIFTPLARDELTGPRGEGYRRMIDLSPAGRGGTPDEVGTVGALLMGRDGAFITGSDFLMDGGVTASYFYGELAP